MNFKILSVEHSVFDAKPPAASPKTAATQSTTTGDIAQVTATSLMVAWFRYWFSPSPALRAFLEHTPVSPLAKELCFNDTLSIDTRFQRVQDTPIAVHPVGYRQAYILEKLRDPSYTQVIVLGSGLTTYSKDFLYQPAPSAPTENSNEIIMATPRTFIEMDLNGHELNLKEKLYTQLDPLSMNTITFIHGNYVNNFEKIVASPNFDPNQKTLIIWEGNTMYLTPDEIQKTFDNIAHAFSTSPGPETHVAKPESDGTEPQQAPSTPHTERVEQAKSTRPSKKEGPPHVDIIIDYFSEALVNFHKSEEPDPLGEDDLENWARTSVAKAFVTGYSPGCPAYTHENMILVEAVTQRTVAKQLCNETPASLMNDHSGMLHFRLDFSV